MATTISRDRIIEALRAALAEREWVRSVWLGGSDATGRTDEWSDIDLMVLVKAGRIDDGLDLVGGTLAALSPIAHRHRLPARPEAGYEQEFLSLRDADPAHFVDVCVLTPDAPDLFLDAERHGEPLVLFDRDGMARPSALDRDAHRARMAARLAVLRETFPMFQTMVTRAVRRGQVATAIDAFVALTLRPLVEVLRMRHCPDRFDYGVRYLDRDLPEEVREAVERLALPRTLEDVEANRAAAEAMFTETLAALDGA